GIEEIAAETEAYLESRGLEEIDTVYGISMGGSIVIRLLAGGRLHIRHAVIDAGVTPRPIPAAYLYAVRDFGFMMALKNSLTVLSAWVPKEKYGEALFMRLCTVMKNTSLRTVWNNFFSCNTYSLPQTPAVTDTVIAYWYGSREAFRCARDRRFVRRYFPAVTETKIPGCNHAEFVMLQPQKFAEMLLAQTDD
ncbi:MAG: alpha/beta hydrolase, partial [Clostridia bacterium]|nr:alpha/beta hydrolase [Clostridia bacterium]